ncbi:hypothetical protein [Microbispora sp. H10830]|uniref:hypothetical protein n=1 Tax=Microbispora sp. H10830 TaxID=2729109 RepID=UPI00160423F1|nr:hypothetical protein [Microbispora sp. H10830]
MCELVTQPAASEEGTVLSARKKRNKRTHLFGRLSIEGSVDVLLDRTPCTSCDIRGEQL